MEGINMCQERRKNYRFSARSYRHLMWWNDRPRHAKVIGLIPDPCTQHVELSLSKILNLKWLLELHFNERLGEGALVMSGTYEDGPEFLKWHPVDAPSHNTDSCCQEKHRVRGKALTHRARWWGHLESWPPL